MGWHNCHMHEFVISDERFGVTNDPWDENPMPGNECLNENDYRLCELGLQPKSRFRYEYDFGDGWEHDVLVELQQLAFFINAYNAYTLQLIIDHYPVKSIKDIGSFFKGPWDQPAVRLFGRTLTLNNLEHDIIRKDYPDPRIHFALVCAAHGCPPLRDEAYVADHLEEQLDDQARQFLATPAKNRVDAGARTVYLSPIFKWYGADFEKKHGSVLAALEPYWPKASVGALAQGHFKIRYSDYDWSLNQTTR